MEVLEPDGATFVIMHESIKALLKNRKLIALIVVPTLLLSSLFFLVFNHSHQPFWYDLLMRDSFIPFTSQQSDNEFTNALTRLKRQSFGLMFVTDLTFLLAYWIISVLSVIASILLSAKSSSYGTGTSSSSSSSSCVDFALLVIRSSKKPLLTGFYTTLLDTGYFHFVLALASPLYAFSHSGLGYVPSSIICYGISAYVLYLYLSVVWILSVVVSVIEENCYGIEALGKAASLINGNRVQGFILNATFLQLSAVLYLAFVTIIQGLGHKWLVNDTVFWLFVLNFSTLIKLFQFATYTVLYFQCKKHHGPW